MEIHACGYYALLFLMLCSEMFHASAWHTDPRFFSPMVSLQNRTQVYIHDCIECTHPLLGTVTGVVLKFFEMV